MHVHFLTDEPNKMARMRALLEPQHHVELTVLGRDGVRAVPEAILMVDADLRRRDRIEQIKNDMRALSEIRERLFVVEKSMRAMVVQAHALGATGILARPQEIVARIEEIKITRQNEAKAADPETPEVTDSAHAIASIFSAVLNGSPISLVDAENATQHVISGVTQSGLATWLDDVRRHHEGTFQHCLLVTGISVGFALHLGFSQPDIKRLGMAATLHDIGKARIPLAILDKPGKLDPTEEATMRLHPVFGFEALETRAGIAPEVLDAVRHHHEYLDGTGYPDGLTADKIPDIVRLLTISDIFAALIEARSYRPPMPRAKAYSIICEMEGKLEPALVRAFQHVALKG
jgi:putative nucleotidyltransferase with HDIG domain